MMRVHEIFSSINGEVSNQHQGSLCTFLRLAGCNFHKNPCKFCDTPQAIDKTSGELMKVPKILDALVYLGNKNIVITGGEPLRQSTSLRQLIWELYKGNYNISVETNGSLFIPYMENVSWVADYKLPSSGNKDRMKLSNFINIKSKDFVKFVVSDRKDFDVAVQVMETMVRDLRLRCKFAFSPCQPVLSAETLQEWMQELSFLRREGAILSLQLHKVIGVK